MKVPAADVPGLHEAFWLWPDDRVASDLRWPAAGEVDIVETYFQHPTSRSRSCTAVDYIRVGE